MEESVTNSLYHRDYREWEPVVITVEPDDITIQNVGGPDRSISAADISRCEILVPKRYRNRRLGEYLKELDMTEGRSMGIPTIQNVLENNGSPHATVVTDEDRTFFRITFLAMKQQVISLLILLIRMIHSKFQDGVYSKVDCKMD